MIKQIREEGKLCYAFVQPLDIPDVRTGAGWSRELRIQIRSLLWVTRPSSLELSALSPIVSNSQKLKLGGHSNTGCGLNYEDKCHSPKKFVVYARNLRNVMNTWNNHNICFIKIMGRQSYKSVSGTGVRLQCWSLATNIMKPNCICSSQYDNV